MQKILILILGILQTSLVFGQKTKPFYQIDMIIFTHQNDSLPSGELPWFPAIEAIPLKSNTGTGKALYTLLPAKLSHLQKEYYALRRKPEYRMLMHYSWRQPAGREHPVQLPENLQNDWKVEGSLGIKQGNYYLLDSKLRFSAKDSDRGFVFAKNERLNANTVYYLDHPQAGMIIKIHKIA